MSRTRGRRLGRQTQPVAPTTRNRRLIEGIASALASRGAGALAPLLMIPVTLPALGPELFGVWMTITAVTGMLIWADLGLGNGLLTKLSAALAHNRTAEARQLILSAYGLVAGLSFALLSMVVFLVRLLPWQAILGVSDENAASASLVVVVTLSIFITNVPLSLIQRVRYASDEVTLSNLFTTGGPILSLTLAWSAVAADLGPGWVVCGASAGPGIANIAATLHFFLRHRELIPTPADRQGAHPWSLLRMGGTFLLISTFSAVAFNVDHLIIASVYDASTVAEYAVPARVLAALGVTITLINQPLWPANARAIARGEISWVKRATAMITALSVTTVGTTATAFLVAGDVVLDLLTRGTQDPDFKLVLSLCGWWTLVAGTSALSMVQNAAGILMPQLIGWILFLALALPGKYLAATTFGPWALPVAGIVAYSLTVLPALLVGYRCSLAVGNARR